MNLPEQSETQERRIDFYKDQFDRHASRLFEYQKERLRLALLSITGTAAFFAWIISAQDQEADNSYPALFYLIPALLNTFGLIYNSIINLIIERHGAFLEFLEIEVLNVSPFCVESSWQNFRRTKDPTKRSGKPAKIMGYFVWIAMIVGSFFLGIETYG